MKGKIKVELTLKQEEGLKTAIAKYRNHDPYCCISGYAGTGKSTLVKFIISALNILPENVAYVAYTGKAAHVLKEKGCPNATTLHRLLYQSYPRADGTFYHKIKRPLDRRYDLIVIDEVSMVNKEMWDLLLSHHIFVIALGDPGQLPCVSGDAVDVLNHPDIFLEEVVRQAKDSEIVRLSMEVREGKPLSLYQGKELQVIDRKDMVSGMYSWADQIIVGKNLTRHQTNTMMRRELHGARDLTPVDGDRIICLHNDWNTCNGCDDALVNGAQGILHLPYIKRLPYVGNVIKGNFIPEENIEASRLDLNKYAFVDLAMDYKIFTDGEPSINKTNFRKIPATFHPKEFDYGYAITCWKAQGSEYNKVLFLAERFNSMSNEEYIKYLYTGITRAKEKLVLVRNY